MINVHESTTEQFRRTGQLEKEGLEPLPPTPITPEAEAQLKNWGLTEQHIQELQSFCASFRYDRCTEKVERLLQWPVFLRQSMGKEMIDLPYFYDVKGRMDGQCGDIARQFVIQAEFSGLIDYLNSALPPGSNQKIVTCYCNGQSKTHFSSKESNHVWNGLALLDGNGEVLETILIDAAFQGIMTNQESGYIEESRICNISKVTSDLEATTKVGWIKIAEDSWEVDVKESVILGVSNDQKYSYGLAFLRIKRVGSIIARAIGRKNDPNEIVVALMRGREDNHSETFLINPLTGQIEHGQSVVSLTPSEKAEITAILELAAQLVITNDLSQYPRDNKLRFKVAFDSTPQKNGAP